VTRIASPTGERVEATPRRAMTPARKRRIWEREGGVCYLCGEPVALEHVEIEHPVPLAHGGSDDDEALRCVHADGCHKGKTKADAKITGHIKRIIARLDGTRRARKPIPSRPFGKQKRKWPKRKF